MRVEHLLKLKISLRRKSVRGCIVSQDLSVLNLVILKKAEKDLPGLTDTEKPRMRGPTRASKIRKLFNLTKDDDDVRKYVNTYRRNLVAFGRVLKVILPDSLNRPLLSPALRLSGQKLLPSRLKKQRDRRSESLAQEEV
ncbi:hypothetical protein Bca52824_041838 [Brassica carinata]|uniref:40S ribosomal protein S6 n=1 Tax=Brassica carinata TaxID=52824 RepID=A0A8X7UY73_BRACI|nr:hypothetical protein Bca52824_041838 [Brassica carinata]